MTEPIKPENVVNCKKDQLPEEVIQSFNELIAQQFDGTSSVIKQADVKDLMIKKGLKEKEIYEKHWLDVEDIYRKAGWKVKYDKCGFSESWYPPTFTFTPS